MVTESFLFYSDVDDEDYQVFLRQEGLIPSDTQLAVKNRGWWVLESTNTVLLGISDCRAYHHFMMLWVTQYSVGH